MLPFTCEQSGLEQHEVALVLKDLKTPILVCGVVKPSEEDLSNGRFQGNRSVWD
jgi:hypothetical protein